MKQLFLSFLLSVMLCTAASGQADRKNLWGLGAEIQSGEFRKDTISFLAGGAVLSYSRALYQEKAFGFYLDMRPKLLFDHSANLAVGGSITLELRVLGMSDEYPIGLKYGWGFHFMNYNAGDAPGFHLEGINYNKIGILVPSCELVNEIGFILYRYQDEFMFGISVVSIDLLNKKKAQK